MVRSRFSAAVLKQHESHANNARLQRGKGKERGQASVINNLVPQSAVWMCVLVVNHGIVWPVFAASKRRSPGSMLGGHECS